VLEALLTVIVIAVLASFAVPAFLKTVEQSRDKEAHVVLEQIRAAEGFYFARFNAYYPASGVVSDVATINLALRLVIESERNWDYSIEGLGGTDFRAVATRLPPGYARSWQVTKDTSTF
jgi:Tfp pilus assembly protein PilE